MSFDDAVRGLERIARNKRSLPVEAKVTIFQEAFRAIGLNATIIETPSGIVVSGEDQRLAERFMNEASNMMATMGDGFNGGQFLGEYKRM